MAEVVSVLSARNERVHWVYGLMKMQKNRKAPTAVGHLEEVAGGVGLAGAQGEDRELFEDPLDAREAKQELNT